MRFDPQAPPFWETERGGGPVTQIQLQHCLIDALVAIREAYHNDELDDLYNAWKCQPGMLRRAILKRMKLHRHLARLDRRGHPLLPHHHLRADVPVKVRENHPHTLDWDAFDRSPARTHGYLGDGNHRAWVPFDWYEMSRYGR